jgi:hypothetical protein
MDNREDAYVFQLSNLGKIDVCVDHVHHTNAESKAG